MFGMGKRKPQGVGGWLLVGLLWAAPAWAAGPFDHLLEGRARPQANSPGGPAWRFAEYGAVRLMPAEPGAPALQHPVVLSEEVLGQRLAQVRTLPAAVPDDAALASRPAGPLLFERDEARDLARTLNQALQAAQPDQDVLFFSAARRGGLLTPQLGVVGRVFVAQGALHLLVAADRDDAVPAWRIGHVLPKLAFGSRSQAAEGIALRAPNAQQRRADWLSWPLAELAGLPAAQPAVAGAAASSPAPLATTSAATPVATLAATSAGTLATPALLPAELIAQRLKRLQALREQGVISPAEYEAQRQRILSEL